MNAFSLFSNFAGVICGCNYNAVYWGLYFVSDTVTLTHPHTSMTGAFGQFAFSCASYFIVIVHRIGAGAIDEGGEVEVDTGCRLTSDVSVCLHCVCENTAGTVKLDGVYTVPAAR